VGNLHFVTTRHRRLRQTAKFARPCRSLDGTASLPVMAERKRQWTALKDLHAERPMVLFETWTLENYVEEGELECKDPRCAESSSTCATISARPKRSATTPFSNRNGASNGRLEARTTEWLTQPMGRGYRRGHVGYVYAHPIQSPADVDKLKRRSWCVDREATQKHAERLADVFGTSCQSRSTERRGSEQV